MIKVYKFIILFIIIFSCNEALAQRTLKMYISEYKITRTGGTDCDGGYCFSGDGTIDLAVDVDDGSWDVDEHCHQYDENNPNQTKSAADYVWDKTYSAACNWPNGGTINFPVEFWDRDQFTCITEVCSGGGFLNAVSDKIADVWVNQAVPANNIASGTYGPYTFTQPYNANFDGGGNCSGSCSVTVYWVVGGAFPTGPDDKCSAVQVGSAPIGLNGNQQTGLVTNNCTGNSPSEPQLGNNGNTSSTWFYFETPATNVPTEYTIRISQDGSDELGMEYRVFRSPYAAGNITCPSISQLTSNTVNNSDGNATTQMEGIDCEDDDAVGRYNCLQANSRYYIMVDGENDCIWPFPNDPWGNFRVRVSANGYTNQYDNICNADDRGTIALNTTNTLYGNNTCATSQPGEVDVQEGPVSTTNMSPTKTMWYKFRTPATGGPYKANISSDYGFTNFDIEMALWSSPLGTCNFLDLVQMEWNDDITLLFNTKSAFTADCLPANTLFYLQVDGDDGGDYGNYQVSINIQNTANSAPTNDNLCNATNMGSSVQYNTVIAQQSSDNECSSVEPGEPFYSGGFQAKYTTWHKFTITSTTSLAPAFMTVDADGTSGNQWYSLGHSTVSNIYKQNGTSSCPTNNMANVSVVDYEDDNFILDPDISNRTFCVEPGATYWVQVDGQTATNILLLNFDQQGNYNINASPSERYTSNDNICNAEDLGTLSFSTNLTIDRQNLCAKNQAGEPFGNESVQTHDHTVWFKFVAPSTNRPHSYKIDMEDLSGNILEFPIPRLYYDPTPSTCGNFSELVSVENVEDEFQWSLDYPLDLVDVTNQRYSCLVPGGTYYLQMTVRDGVADAPVLGADNYMNFRLNIISDQETTATNDEPCTATWINGTGIIPAAPLPINIPNQNYGAITTLNNQNNFCATAGNPNADLPTSDYQDIDQTVWYKFKAPKSGSVLFQITTPYDDEITIQAAVYQPLKFNCSDIMLEVSSMGQTAIIDRDIEWSDKFYAHCLIPDSVYYLRVDGVWLVGAPTLNDEFRGKFKVEARDYDAWKATNDEICNAISLGTPTSGGVSAKNVQYPSYAGVYPTNYCATAYGEPVPTAFSPVNTVWYSFIAPPSGRVAVKAINDPAGTGDEIWLRLAVWKTSDFTCAGTPIELASDVDDGSITGFDGDLCNLVNPTFGDAEHCIPPPAECEAHRDEFISEVKCLDPGKPYYIMVDGWSYNNPTTSCGDGNDDKYGRFDLVVYDLGGPAPNVANDNACNAENMGVIGNVPGNFKQRLHQNNSCATIEAGEPDPLGWDYNGGTSLNTSTNDGPQKTLWYKFVAPITGSVTIQAWQDNAYGDNSLDLQLAVYDPGTNPCDITKFKEVKAQYDRLLFGAFGSKDEDMQVNCLIPGKTYYLQVDGDQTSVSCLDGGGVLDAGYLNGDNCIDGFFNLKITTALTGILATNNDDLCIAQNLGNIPDGGSKATAATESNWCATEEVGEPNTSQTSNQYDPDYDETVWYRFKTGANPGTIKAEITNATLLNALVFGGSFLISIYESKSNCPTTTCSGSTPNWSDLVMKANSDIILAPVSPFLSPANEELSMACAKPNWNYYIQIDALDLPALEINLGGLQVHTQYGTFKLTVSSDGGGTPPLEDNPCNAVDMGTLAASGTLQSLNRNNYCAGIDPGEPWVNGDANDVNSINYDETVWYKFKTANTPGQSRNIRFRVDGDNLLDPDPIDIGFVVYEGSPTCTNTACNTGYPTPSFGLMREMDRADVPYVFDESVNIECLKPNTTYYIQIDGNDFSGLGLARLDFGNFNIYLTDLGSGPIQNNDLVCYSTDLGTFTGGAQTFTLNTQSNACASEQNGEPNVSGGSDFSADSYDETVWYYFKTGASPGEVTINVNGCPYASRWQGFTVYRGVVLIDAVVNNPTGNGLSNGSINITPSGGIAPYTFDWADVSGGNNTEDRTNIPAGTYTVTITDASGATNSASFTLSQPSQLTANILGTTNTTCNSCNGAISIAASGGVAPYTFDWADISGTINQQNRTGLCSGTYNVIVRDKNNNSSSLNIVVNSSSKPVLSSNITNTSCGNCSGSVDINISNGTAPYEYDWTDISGTANPQDRTNLCAGNYIVYVTDALNCKDTLYNIVNNTSTTLSITSNVHPVSCVGINDGAIDLTITGGTLPYSIDWLDISGISNSEDRTNLASKDYIVTVTDNVGCKKTLAITVPSPNALSLNAGVKNSYCDLTDGTIYPIVTGGTSPYIYDWTDILGSNDIKDRTGLTAGNYTLTVTDIKGCSISKTFTINSANCLVPNLPCLVNNFSKLSQVGQTGISGCNPTLKLTCLEPNTYYYIQVDAYDDLIDGNVDGNGFNISVTDNGVVTSRPTNDQIANVHNFGVLLSPGTLTRTRAGGYYSVLNNYCATDEVNEPNADWSVPDDDVNADETVWYRFTMSFTGDASLDFTNTNLGSEVNIIGNLYRNTGPTGAATFANLQHVGSFTQVPFILQDFTFSCLTPGEYYIQVDGLDIGGNQDPDASSGTNLSRGEWDLTIRNTAPAFPYAQHDNILNAYNLGTPACGGAVSLPFNSNETNNTCATVQVGEPNIDNNDETVWFYFTAPAGANSPITVTVDGDDAPIAGRDWDMHPSIYVYHSTTGAVTTNFGELEQVGSGGTIIPDYINKTATATFDCPVPGHVYYVQIDGWDGPLADEYGKFSISVSSGACPVPPANDEPCSATNLGTPGTNTCTSAGYAGGGTNSHQYNFNANATVSNTPSGLWDDACANSYCAGDVWYKFTAAQTGNVIIEGSQQGSNIAGIPTQPTEIGVSVYRQIGSCANLQYVTCKTGGITPLSGTDMELETSVAVTAGETYYIKVYDADGSYNAQWYRLCLTQTCSADNCAAALTLQDGVSQCWDLETTDAEPLAQSYRDCNTNEVAKNSIYYKFTTSSDPVAAASGVNITMFGNMNVASNFLGIQYTGCTAFGIFACDRNGVSVGIFEDATPCDGSFDKLMDCITTDVCNGGAWGFSKDYTNLKPATTYIIQVNSQDDGVAINCAASLDAIDFGSITVSSLDTNVPALPIELVSFTGYNNGSVNILNWTTASELNNDFFTVERSFDGVNFIPIGVVEGAGNSISILNYALTDASPQIGNNYYRLKQTDYDGKYSYSQIINIPIQAQEKAITSITGVYPNPTTGQLNIELFVAEEKLDLNFRVTNIVGQSMRDEYLYLTKGSHKIIMDATDYAAGMYLINMINKEYNINLDHKFIKQ